ncbi:MAG: heavy metal translocating P-type ATPase, partial [Chloroflexaceae bacterium]|nr:heavy metal translocating P-type ATPase [Chloroflexaceae bacterium]
MTTLTHTNTPASKHWPLRFDAAWLEPLLVVLTLIGIVSGVLLEWLGVNPMTVLMVHIATYITGGFYAVREIIAALKERRIEVDMLMVLAALGAAYVDAWTDGAILLFL